VGPNYVGQNITPEQMAVNEQYVSPARLAPAAPPARMRVGKWTGTAGVGIGAALFVYALMNFLINVVSMSNPDSEAEEIGASLGLMAGTLFTSQLLILAVLMMGFGYVARRLAP
jgi:hypothetical protein